MAFSSDNRAASSSGKVRREFRSAGTHCIWPSGVQKRYDIDSVTRWRWERDGRLPARDVYVGGKPIGWKPETLDAADRGKAAA